jgi:hypothetical protein
MWLEEVGKIGFLRQGHATLAGDPFYHTQIRTSSSSSAHVPQVAATKMSREFGQHLFKRLRHRSPYGTPRASRTRQAFTPHYAPAPYITWYRSQLSDNEDACGVKSASLKKICMKLKVAAVWCTALTLGSALYGVNVYLSWPSSRALHLLLQDPVGFQRTRAITYQNLNNTHSI